METNNFLRKEIIMGDDVKCRAMVIFATIGKTRDGKLIQHFIKESSQGDYELMPGVKGAATFDPPSVQKFIKAANTPYKLQPMPVK